MDFEEPLAMIFGPFIYALFANICYTFGWIVDTVAYRAMPRTHLYKYGIVLSAILTALPGLWAVMTWLMMVVTGPINLIEVLAQFLITDNSCE